MEVTGIGPYIKRGTMKLFIAGTGFSVGDTVTLELTTASGSTTTRSGTVIELASGGCIARIGPRVEDKDITDDDLVEVTVTVTNGSGESDSSSEPGIEE
ncbi:MAG: hypothetical protein R3C53_24885 [Pirellulaceae bacterium]